MERPAYGAGEVGNRAPLTGAGPGLPGEGPLPRGSGPVLGRGGGEDDGGAATPAGAGGAGHGRREVGLPVGAYAVDTRTGRVGTVMGYEGPYVQLRPLGGGREWDCDLETVRAATSAERIRAATSRANARSRGDVT